LTPGKDGLKQLELRLDIEVVKKCSFSKVSESPWGACVGNSAGALLTALHSVTRLLKNKHLTFVSLSSIVRVVLTGSGAGQYQQLDKATATGGKPQNGQQPCSLWPPVWATVTAASGGLKRWEKLSFRAVDLPPDDGAELCPDERLLALGHLAFSFVF
jgi:hypothetical protein